MKKLIILITFLGVFFYAKGNTNNGKNKIDTVQVLPETDEIVQSIYYDAIELYHLMYGYGSYIEEYTIGRDVFYRNIEIGTGIIISDGSKKPDLKEIKDNSLRKTLIDKILNRNSGFKDKAKTRGELFQIYGSNDFIKDYLPTMDSLSSKIVRNNLSNRAYSSSTLGAGTITTTIAEGISGFYIDRINEEVNEAFLVQFQKVLEKYPELKTLFPKTISTLKKLEVINYSYSLNTLKYAFHDDIELVLGHIPELYEVKGEKYKKLADKYDKLTLLFIGCDAIDMCRRGVNIPEIIHNIGTRKYLNSKNNYSSTIQLAALMSFAFRDIRVGDKFDIQDGWISKEKVNSLINDTLLFRVFMGLIAQRGGSVNINKTTFGKLLNDNCNSILAASSRVVNIQKRIDEITKRITSINNKNQNKQNAPTYAYIEEYSKLVIDIVELSEAAISFLPIEKEEDYKLYGTIADIKTKYLPLLDLISEVNKHLESKEYSMAIKAVDSIAGYVAYTLVDKAIIAEHKPYKGIVNKSDKTLKENGVNKYENFEKVRSYYRKYGTFAASVLEAEDSDDVKNAIHAISLPRGSSRIKKAKEFSAGINSYVGFYNSWNDQNIDTDFNIPRNETGITAPLGFAVNKNFANGKIGSLSLYFGIIDVGAIFTYKVNTDSSLQSTIDFNQILSPSVGVIYGLPIIKKYNIPLSIGINYQWGPRLQKVSSGENSVLPLLAKRLNVFIAFDLPMLNFYTSKN